MFEQKINKLTLCWFHRYPARFSLEVLTQILSSIHNRLGRWPKNIFDPFAGTGASLALAKQLGIPAYGIEISDLGVLISEVRLNPPENLYTALEITKKLTNSQKKGDYEKINDELIAWIGKENAAKLDYLLNKIEEIENLKLKKWVTLAVSSALRPSSRWLSGSIKPQIDPNRKYTDIYKHFLRIAKILRKDCELESKYTQKNVTIKIIKGESQKLEFKDNFFESIITSPPYGSMYNYFDVHRLSYLAFGWEKFDKSLIGRSSRIEKDGYCFIPPSYMKKWYYQDFKGESTIKGRALRAYFQDMEKHLVELYRVLCNNGLIAYSIANSVKNGKKFPIVESIAELLEKVGFTNIEIKPRKQSKKRILPSGRNIKTGRFDSQSKSIIDEFIIYAIK